MFRISKAVAMFDHGLRNFAQPGAWVPLSQNEALRMKKSSGGRSTPAGALSGAGGLAGLENPESTKLAWPDFAAAGIGRIDDGPADSRAVRFDVTPALWRGGFKAAHRHSALVRLFRRVAIASSLLAIALVSAVALLNPLRRLPGDISVGRAALDGTKITLDFPKISGVQTDGRPFEIKARSGIQDIMTPHIIELLGIDSKIGTPDASTTWVSAARGIYDSLHDKMTLEGDIRIKNSAGYDSWLTTARIDFNTGGLVSEEPVKVILDGGTIAAKQLDVSDNGHKVSFGGAVTSMIDTGAEAPEAAGAMDSGK
ncbi:MAG: LPS export ABC transporter periplasmic protein LptC [Methylocella sp.]